MRLEVECRNPACREVLGIPPGHRGQAGTCAYCGTRIAPWAGPLDAYPVETIGLGDCWGKMRQVLSRPRAFFEAESTVRGSQPALVYLACFQAVTLLVPVAVGTFAVAALRVVEPLGAVLIVAAAALLALLVWGAQVLTSYVGQALVEWAARRITKRRAPRGAARRPS